MVYCVIVPTQHNLHVTVGVYRSENSSKTHKNRLRHINEEIVITIGKKRSESYLCTVSRREYIVGSLKASRDKDHHKGKLHIDPRGIPLQPGQKLKGYPSGATFMEV